MMKRILGLLPLVALVACENSFQTSKDTADIIGLDAAKICSGEVIGGVTGTANCSGGGGSVSVAEGLYVLSARNDISSVDDWSDPLFLAGLVDGAVNRTDSVLVLQDIYSNSNPLDLFKTKYQTIPNPVTDSDGRFSGNGAIEKQHYLERIVGRPDQECGTTGTIPQRIADCAKPIADGGNGARAYYNGRQYGQAGEGDWKLVTLVYDGGTKYEVWRDERTKLLWSDKAAATYNWYVASGYVKDNDTSSSETGLYALTNNPSPHISLCAEVDDNGVVVGGGAVSPYDGGYMPTSDASIEKAFKGNLNASNDVIWKLPSADDFKLADVNGIRKVLPNMDSRFWSSSSYSGNRGIAWYFGGDSGNLRNDNRNNAYSVRCVALSRD